MMAKLLEATLVLIGTTLAAVGFFYLIALFVSVIFLGGSSACPQNLC